MEGKETAEVSRVEAARRRLIRAEEDYKRAIVEEESRRGSGITQLAGEAAGQTVFTEEARPIDLDWIFSYHSPSFEDRPKYTAIRSAAKYFAQVIIDNAPGCADRTAAIRHVRDAVMTANASIALGGHL